MAKISLGVFNKPKILALVALCYVASSAIAAAQSTVPSFAEPFSIEMRLKLPSGAKRQFSIPIGAIVVADNPEYQPLAVTSVRLLNSKGTANEFLFDEKSYSYFVMISSKEEIKLEITGFCMAHYAKAPLKTTKYKFTNTKVPFETMKKLEMDPTRTQQSDFWFLIDKYVSDN